MKQYFVFMAMGLGVLLAASGAYGTTHYWDVATVHGYNQFTIGDDTTTLLYHQQPRNDQEWYWDNNNGSAPGVLATGGFGPNGWRDGSRTFAMTDIAYGMKLSDLILEFDYYNSYGGYVTMNFFVTDGHGHYGIFSPASGGIGAVATQNLLNGWTRMTLDLTRDSIPDAASCAIYEHNGLSDEYGNPFTSMTWGNIKNLTIAGMYDYQRSPAGGWDAWGTMFDDQHGLALIWGDTVGNTTYTTQERMIGNVWVSFAGETEASQGLFRDAQVPEPASMVMLGMLGAGMAATRLRKRNKKS